MLAFNLVFDSCLNSEADDDVHGGHLHLEPGRVLGRDPRQLPASACSDRTLKIAYHRQQPCPLPAKVASHGYLLYVGRLHAQKRIDILIRAYRRAAVREHLVLLGRGDERERLEALAGQMGIAERVHFVGFVANPYPWMRSSRALVLPSAYEGFGNVRTAGEGAPVYVCRRSIALPRCSGLVTARALAENW